MGLEEVSLVRIQLITLIEQMQRPGDGTAATCRRLSVELGRQVKPVRHWSWEYIHQVAHGKLEPSRFLAQAISRFYTKERGEPIQYEKVTVIAPVGMINPESVVNNSSQTCAYEKCGRMFVPTHPAQIYCSNYCRRARRRLSRASSKT